MTFRTAVLLACMPMAAALAQGPGVTIVTRDGIPQVEMDNIDSTCPESGITLHTRQDIVDAAAAEWSLFRFPRFAVTPVKTYNVIPPALSPGAARTRAHGAFVPRLFPVGHMEDEAAVRERIGTYWAAVGARKVFADQNQVWRSSYGQAGWVQYWSAAFVSYVMCRAGLTGEQFVRDGAHVRYIRPAVAQRDGIRRGYAYTAYDLGEQVPAPGDLLCAAGDDQTFSINDLASFRRNPQHWAFHCEIVVGFDVRNPREASVLYGIGGNVINAVSLTEVPIRNGRVVKVRMPNGRNWFALLKLQDGTGHADFRRIPAQITRRAEALTRRAGRH